MWRAAWLDIVGESKGDNMGEFLTQPVQMWQLVIVVGAVLLFSILNMVTWNRLWNEAIALISKKVSYEVFSGYRDRWNNAIYRLDLAAFKVSGLPEKVALLTETVDSMSDTLWEIEDDVEALRVPVWKRVLRKLSA